MRLRATEPANRRKIMVRRKTMKKRKGFTLVELLVVIAIIALLMGVLMPALAKVRAIAYRLTCGTNLSGIGKSMIMYASDYNEDFPRGGYKGPSPPNRWSASGHITCFPCDTLGQAFGSSGDTTIGSCYFLLIKYEEVGVKQFVCKGDAGTKSFKLSDALGSVVPPGRKVEECWDFGGYDTLNVGQPGKAYSYAYQYPFTITPHPCPGAGSSGTSSAFFGVNSAARPGTPVSSDRNPYLDANAKGHLDSAALDNPMGEGTPQQWSDKDRKANCAAHQWEGQNVMYVDAHVSFEKYPTVGIRNDHIWKCWTDCASGDTDIGRQCWGETMSGCYPKQNGDTSNYPKNVEDAYLIGETNY